jgi:hypothetical protein
LGALRIQNAIASGRIVHSPSVRVIRLRLSITVERGSQSQCNLTDPTYRARILKDSYTRNGSIATFGSDHSTTKMASIDPAISKTETFVYEPLDQSKSQIRLLQILPSGDFNSKVQCNMWTTNLDQAAKDGYCALSYVWGNESQRRPL